MEKMKNESAKEIFDTINDAWNDYVELNYGDGQKIKFYYNISMVDIINIVNIVVGACEPIEQLEMVKMRAILARCIIEYLTDLPLPIMELDKENGEKEEVEDYPACYEFIYGYKGMKRQHCQVQCVVDMLEHYVMYKINEQTKYSDPVNMFVKRITEVGNEWRAAIDDALNDPDSPLNQALETALAKYDGSGK